MRPILRSAVVWVLLAPALARGQTADDFGFRVLDIKGYPGERVKTSVLFDNSGTHGVRGFQLALKVQDCAGVKLAEGVDPATDWYFGAEPGAAVLQAEFLSVDCSPADGWVRQGVVIDNQTVRTLPPGLSYEVLKLTFDLTGAGCGCTVHIVRFPDTILDPPIWTSIDAVGDDGSSIVFRELNKLYDGRITCKGRPPCCPAGTPPADCPPAKFPAEPGLDIMETKSPSFRFALFGLGTYDVDADGLSGPTIVYRSAPGTDCRTLDTGLTRLLLEGKIAGAGWRVVVSENNDTIGGKTYSSTGTVKPLDCSNMDYDFPARSEFNLHFKVSVYKDPGASIPDMVLFNKDPKIQRNQICRLPPVSEDEPYEPPAAIDLYDITRPEGKPVGQVLGAHNPEYVVPIDETGPVFIRGDCNTDGLIDLSDGIKILTYLFVGDPQPPRCLVACDANGSACDKAPGSINQPTDIIDITDGIHMFRYLFIGGPAPAAPFKPFCGRFDPCWKEKSSRIGCAEYPPAACGAALLLR